MKKEKPQLGQKASSLVSGELHLAQTKLQLFFFFVVFFFFADKHFLMHGCLCEVRLFVFLFMTKLPFQRRRSAVCIL